MAVTSFRPMKHNFYKPCLFCGTLINPRVYSNGRTRHVDHYIPLCIIALISRFRPDLYIPNVLLPCCIRCNNFASSYLFWSVNDKRDYVQSRTGIAYKVEDSLLSHCTPLDLKCALISSNYLQTAEFGLIWAIARDPVTNLWRRDELAITRAAPWNFSMVFMEPSKTAF